MRKLFALFLVGLFLLAGIIPAFAADWTEFGGSPERMRATDRPMGMPMMPIWGELDVGMSSSQPIVIGDTIYLLAGDAVWALDGSKPPGTPPDELVTWATDGINTGIVNNNLFDATPEQVSRSHPTFCRINNVLYVGTGRYRNPATGITGGSVVAIDPQTGRFLGRIQFPGNIEIVSAPLSFPNDTVVVGTTDGRVQIIRGLKTNNPSRTMVAGSPGYGLGGVVSSSPTKTGPNTFVIGADAAGGQGRVMAFTVGNTPAGDFRHVWPRPVTTPRGVPASFAVQGDVVYFSDKGNSASGSRTDVVFYAVNKNDGSLIWRTPPRRQGFINNSPAVGNRYVYFTMRRDAEKNTGALVAIEKASGNIGWIAELRDQASADSPGDPAWGNTAPLFLSSPFLLHTELIDGDPAKGYVEIALQTDPGWNVVLVGDTKGQISAWIGEPGWYGYSVTAGAPTLFQRAIPSPIEGLGEGGWMSHNYTRLVDFAYEDPVFWRNTSGVGMELTPAVLNGQPALLGGANAADGAGIFMALEMKPYLDAQLGFRTQAGNSWFDSRAAKLQNTFPVKDIVRQIPGEEAINPEMRVNVPLAPEVQVTPGQATLKIDLAGRFAGWEAGDFTQATIQWFWLSNPAQKQTRTVSATWASVNAWQLEMPPPAQDDTLVVSFWLDKKEHFLFNNFFAIPVKAAPPPVVAPPAPSGQGIDLSVTHINATPGQTSPGFVALTAGFRITGEGKERLVRTSARFTDVQRQRRVGGWSVTLVHGRTDSDRQNVFLPITLPPGTYTIEVMIDHDNLVAETNENNNRARVTFTVPEPRSVAPAPDPGGGPVRLVD